MPTSEIPWKKIAVFDINHGGLSIAKQLKKHGISVVAFDVYGKASPEKLKEFEDENGYPVSSNVNDIETEEFEIVCLPIHLNPENEYYKKAIEGSLPTITHHEMVGRILRSDSRIADMNMIEITGVRGKTSTAILLAQMLSFKDKVLLHTSEGLSYWEKEKTQKIKPGISITPAYIPDLIDCALSQGYRPTTLIFEVSLGYTGSQDIGILTEAQPDYLIGGGAMSSTDAKTKLISRSKEGSIFVINYDDLETIEKYIRDDQELVVFDDSGAAIEDNTPTDVYLNVATGKDGTETVDIESSRTGIFFRTELNTGYNIHSYKTAMAAAVATALELDVSEAQITEIISSFSGVEGRMREYEENGCFVMDNSNSGLTIDSAEMSLNYMLEKYLNKKSPNYDADKTGYVWLIIGEEDKTVCEGLEPKEIENFLKNYAEDIQKTIFVGSRIKTHIESRKNQPIENAEELEDLEFETALYADTFKDGMKKAFENANEGDIIIAAVKCFR